MSTPAAEWSLVLPPGWVRLPLERPSYRALARLAAPSPAHQRAHAIRGVGRAPQPGARAVTLGALADLLTAARDAGAAAAYALADEVAGCPLPASLIVAQHALPGLAELDAAPDVLARELAAVLDGDVTALPAGPAVVRRTRSEAAVVAQAHVPVPGSSGLLVLTASSPLVALADPWERLFLALFATLRWRRRGRGGPAYAAVA